MEELRTVLKDVFGESSSDSEAEQQKGELKSQSQSLFGKSQTWQKIAEINGLWLCRDFLSPEQQSCFLSHIQNEGWFNETSCNQAMRFGDLPLWAIELSNLIREVVLFANLSDVATPEEDKESCVLPSELLRREPLFDQLIVNKYEPGEGICPHVDLMRFADGIAIVSLESSVVMHFTRAESQEHQDRKSEEAQRSFSEEKVAVYLTPGSLVLMWGEARYHWKHEINRKPGFQLWQGQAIDQQRRISITLRKLCKS